MLSNLQNVFARRDLLKALVGSELQSSVARSKLGWVWWFLDPVLMMRGYSTGMRARLDFVVATSLDP